MREGTKEIYTSTSTPATMRVSNIAVAAALLLTGASALDKPLNIEVLKSVDCSTKTKEGQWNNGNVAMVLADPSRR